jgi:hypothetical protein
MAYGEGHESKQSCRICDNTGGNGFGIDIALSLKEPWSVPSGSGTVITSAWVRLGSLSEGKPTTHLHVQPNDGLGKVLPLLGTEEHALDSNWQKLSFQGGLGADAKTIDLIIGAEIASGACVEIDDVKLSVVP